jgi:hypothetical protein
MMMGPVFALALASGAGLDGLPRRIADGARRQETPPSLPAERPGKASPFIDWDWLEVQPRVGLVAYSEDYEADPSWSAGVLARAPLPWLSPGSDPRGEYFGVFAEIAVAGIDRDLDPAPDDSSGVLVLGAVGLDFTILRTSTWMVLVQAGPQYVSFGGVSDLEDGFGGMAGLSLGFSPAEGVSLTLGPEVWFGRAGDRIYLASLGAMIHF